MHIARDIKPWHGVTLSRRCLDVSGSFVSSEHTILFFVELWKGTFFRTVCHLNFTDRKSVV